MDKIEKIRKEIERRKLLLIQHSKLIYDLILEVFIKEYDDILSFIDTLSEEPDKDLEKVVDAQMEEDGDVDHFVRKELDEVALKYARLGAKWQKCQMIKEAVEADVNTYKDLAAGKSWAEFVVEMPTNNLGDKVKLIVIKEED